MSKFFNKLSIPTAVDKRNTFDLSSDHVTTMDWLTPKVSYIKEIVPGESLDVNLESFVRLNPLIVPTFGRINLTHRAYFVPMRVLWNHWNNFITQTISPLNSIPASVPYVLNSALASAIVSSSGLVQDGSSTLKDITYIESSSSTSYHVLTSKGRRVMDRLNTLGVHVNFNYADSSKISLLPILAYWKLLHDWYLPNQYSVNNLFELFKKNYVDVNSGSVVVTNELLDVLAYTGTYDQDYFTSAWAKPNGPQSNVPSITLPNVGNDTSSGAFVDVSMFNSEALYNNSSRNVNQFAVDALKHLSDFLKRYQLAGSRAIDRYLVRFGINLQSEKINRVSYLGSCSTPISIGDVICTSQNDDKTLGDFAGKGIGYGNNGKFNLSSDEFGYFIVLSQITPKLGYVQGIDRSILHLSPQDFYTHEFDALGTQAIAAKELYCTMNGNYTNQFLTGNSAKIFGFIPRYAEYKVGKDRLSGSYLFDSVNQGENSWYTFRQLPDDLTQLLNYNTAGDSFIAGGDKDQFNRIFQTDSPGYDQFRVIMHFDVKASLPMSTLFDNYEFCENGKQVSLQINGRNNNGAN